MALLTAESRGREREKEGWKDVSGEDSTPTNVQRTLKTMQKQGWLKKENGIKAKM